MMFQMRLLRFALLAAVLAANLHAQDSTTPELIRGGVIQVDGKPHSFDLFIPGSDTHAPPMPLLVALHGAGGNGRGQINAWLSVARANKFIVLAPNIDNSPQAWDTLYAHPEWICGAIDALAKSYPIDRHRLYLWGYSAGGMFMFYFSFLESRYFAAAAVHGGVIEDNKYEIADLATRKIPIAYYIGTRDQWWSTKQTRATRDALLLRGFEVHYVELKGEDHNFFTNSGEITEDAWQFFKQHRLPDGPIFDPLDREKIKNALRE